MDPKLTDRQDPDRDSKKLGSTTLLPPPPPPPDAPDTAVWKYPINFFLHFPPKKYFICEKRIDEWGMRGQKCQDFARNRHWQGRRTDRQTDRQTGIGRQNPLECRLQLCYKYSKENRIVVKDMSYLLVQFLKAGYHPHLLDLIHLGQISSTSDRSHPPRIDLIHNRLNVIQNSARSHPPLIDLILLGSISSTSAKSHPPRIDLIHNRLNVIYNSARSHPPRLDLIHNRLNVIQNSARSHPPRLDLIPTRLDLIHNRLNVIQNSARSHPPRLNLIQNSARSHTDTYIWCFL